MTTTARPMTRRQAVELHLKAARTERTILRNLRLGRYTGRNSASQDRHLAALQADRERAIEALRANRHLIGLLVEEASLASRVQEARDQGQDRPELRERLNYTRRAIRRAI